MFSYDEVGAAAAVLMAAVAAFVLLANGARAWRELRGPAEGGLWAAQANATGRDPVPAPWKGGQQCP